MSVRLPDGHYYARQYGVGRTNSGPSGHKKKPARLLAAAKGVQAKFAMHKWIWQLYKPKNWGP
jgi:hypothetical protein